MGQNSRIYDQIRSQSSLKSFTYLTVSEFDSMIGVTLGRKVDGNLYPILIRYLGPS